MVSQSEDLLNFVKVSGNGTGIVFLGKDLFKFSLLGTVCSVFWARGGAKLFWAKSRVDLFGRLWLLLALISIFTKKEEGEGSGVTKNVRYCSLFSKLS